MRPPSAACIVALLVGACAGCHSAPRSRAVSRPWGATAAPPAARPKTVPALRYRKWIARDFRSAQHGVGQWIEELWFPEWQLCANAQSDGYDEPSRLNVFPSDRPQASTRAGLQWLATGEDEARMWQGPTKAVQVPWDLAQRIRAAGDLRTRLEAQRDRIGPDLIQSGVLRQQPYEGQ